MKRAYYREGVIGVLALLVGGCAATLDSVGNIYPEVCRGEMTCTYKDCTLNGKTVSYSILSPHEMPKSKDGKPYWGWYNYGSGMASVNSMVPYRNDILRHEACHAIAGRWHPE